jgi:hypothetical protein
MEGRIERQHHRLLEQAARLLARDRLAAVLLVSSSEVALSQRLIPVGDG